MADKTFHLEVITPDRNAVSKEVVSLQLRAADGRMGVLHNHAPLIAMLDTGRLFCSDSQGGKTALAIGDGFVEILKNNVKVLCEFADFEEEIDLDRAEKAKKRAMEKLSRRSSPEVDELRAEAALRRSMVRLKLGGRG